MRHIVIRGLPALPYFSILSHTRNRFRKISYWTSNVFWVSLQLLSETFHILSRTERDIIKKCTSISVFLYSSGIIVRFERNLNFLDKISGKSRANRSSGKRVVLCERTDGHDEANSHFSQTASASKNYSHQQPLNISPTNLAIFVTWAVCWLTCQEGNGKGKLWECSVYTVAVQSYCSVYTVAVQSVILLNLQQLKILNFHISITGI